MTDVPAPATPRKPKTVHKVDELEAMRQCDRIISQIADKAEQVRIATWLFDRYQAGSYLAPSRAEELLREATGN